MPRRNTFYFTLFIVLFYSITHAEENEQVLSFKLIGSQNISLEVGTEFYDPGYEAFSNIDGDISDKVVTSSQLDSKKVGMYVIEYSLVTSSGTTDTKYRYVEVIDTQAPKLELIDSYRYHVKVGQVFKDPGAMYYDNYSGTGIIYSQTTVDTSSPSEILLEYNFVDGSGNKAETIYRNLRIDTGDTPIITLLGDNPYYLEYLHTFEEPGYLVEDTEDGNLHLGNMYVTGTIDSSTLGPYDISYYISDSDGNIQFEQRRIYVADGTSPEIILQGNEEEIIEKGSYYTDVGALWSDNYDGTGTIFGSGQVDTNLVGEYVLYYNFIDSNLNVAETKIRKIHIVDSFFPSLQLFGNENMEIPLGGKYIEPGFLGKDVFGHTVNSNISLLSNLNVEIPGNYEIIYELQDAYTGKKTSKKRQIYVYNIGNGSGNNKKKTATLKTYSEEDFLVGNSQVEEDSEKPFQLGEDSLKLSPVKQEEKLVTYEQYFTDVKNKPLKQYLKYFISQGYIKIEEPLFHPKNTISKIDFLNLLFKATQSEKEKSHINIKGQIQKDILLKALKSKIIRKNELKKFFPNAGIKRIEALKYVILLKGYTLSSSSCIFTDIQDETSKKFAQTGMELGIITGIKKGEELKFFPNAYLSREEAINMIYKSK